MFLSRAKFWIILLVVLLLYLQYRIWLSPNGMLYIWHLEKQIKTQTERNTKLSDCNESLKQEIISLRNTDEALEERARYELGFIKPGEKFVIMENKSGRLIHRNKALIEKCDFGL